MGVERGSGLPHVNQDVATKATRAATMGDWCTQCDIIYTQKESLAHSPWHFMSNC